MSECAVGVDGGGTHTRAAMADEGGCITAFARGGCGNFQTLGMQALEALLEGLLHTLGARPPLRALCLALAGAGRAPEQEAIAARVRARGWADAVCVVGDARAALEGALGGRAGIIAIAGTGSMVLGKSPAGREVRAGGWGPLLGDEGSGYWLGLEALRAVLRARDGRREDTRLAGALAAELGLEAWEHIVSRVYGGDVGRERIAALAPCVFAAAREGDATARALVEAAGAELGEQVAAVALRLDLAGGVDLACAGGLFAEREALWPPLVGAALRRGVHLHWRPARLPPVLGAVLLAARQAGWQVGADLVENLAQSCPDRP